MFRSEDVFHTLNVIPKDRVNAVISKLHETGVCQLKPSEAPLEAVFEYAKVKDLDETHRRLAFIMDTLEEYSGVVTAENLVKELFFPSKPVKYKIELFPNEVIIQEINEDLESIEPKVMPNLKRLEEIKEKIKENKFIASNLQLLPEIKTSLFQETDNLQILLGIISLNSLKKIEPKLKENAVYAVKEREDKKTALLAAFSLKEKASAVERLLHEAGFEILKIPYTEKTPSQLLLDLEKEGQQLEKEERQIKQAFRKLWQAYHTKLDLLYEELNVVRQRVQALEQIKSSESFAVLEAWVPKKDFSRFQKVLASTTEHYTEITEKAEAPTILKNPGLFKPFEIITGLYSLPKYKDLDPTPVLAFSFALFFGFMLTDVAYGLMLAALAFMIYRGAGQYNPSLRQFAALMILVGIATAVLGAFFGSWFGDFFQRLGWAVPAFLDPMRQVLEVIIIALVFATVHLTLGLIMGFYEGIRKHQLRKAIPGQLTRLLFVFGAIAFIALPALPMAALGLIVLGVLLHVVFKAWEGGPVIGLLSVFDFTSFIGDLCSYSRLAALAVGTAGIALAINFMALMVVDMIPYVGILVGVVVFIVGHIFNMVMNGLGAFIHSLRLHFLEFFQKFYSGGGKAYQPFFAERKKYYTEVK